MNTLDDKMNPNIVINIHIIALFGPILIRGENGSWITKNKFSPSIDDTDNLCILSASKLDIIL